ncbi:unnamed protein product [Soboliphyme baturini]|uniref:Membrane protein UL56 n=1 Tax=Soboliphyme baturini TaxID=241478 RepID=A0A183IFM1_9BILA|nr:unnamed protein product [Soboliphyme baturini]
MTFRHDEISQLSLRKSYFMHLDKNFLASSRTSYELCKVKWMSMFDIPEVSGIPHSKKEIPEKVTQAEQGQQPRPSPVIEKHHIYVLSDDDTDYDEPLYGHISDTGIMYMQRDDSTDRRSGGSDAKLVDSHIYYAIDFTQPELAFDDRSTAENSIRSQRKQKTSTTQKLDKAKRHITYHWQEVLRTAIFVVLVIIIIVLVYLYVRNKTS